MGNHEFCVDCEENNFHHGRPCNPEKVRLIQERKARYEKLKQANIGRMKRFLAFHGIEYTIDEYGYARIDSSHFAEGNGYE